MKTYSRGLYKLKNTTNFELCDKNFFDILESCLSRLAENESIIHNPFTNEGIGEQYDILRQALSHVPRYRGYYVKKSATC